MNPGKASSRGGSKTGREDTRYIVVAITDTEAVWLGDAEML